MDPHDLLDVPPGADERQIRRAFRAYASRHHPDVGGDERSFTRGLEAYRRLTEAPRRRNDVVFYRRRRPVRSLGRLVRIMARKRVHRIG